MDSVYLTRVEVNEGHDMTQANKHLPRSGHNDGNYTNCLDTDATTSNMKIMRTWQ